MKIILLHLTTSFDYFHLRNYSMKYSYMYKHFLYRNSLFGTVAYINRDCYPSFAFQSLELVY